MPPRGFSLPELLVALALSAAVAAAALPSFRQQRATAALQSATTQTLSALHLARRLALARGQTVTVCPSIDGVSCTLQGNAWLLFANTEPGVDSRLEGDDELLRHWETPRAVRVSGTRGYATFQPRPGAATTVTFIFCTSTARVPPRRVIVSQTGRPRLEHDDAGSTTATCP